MQLLKTLGVPPTVRKVIKRSRNRVRSYGSWAHTKSRALVSRSFAPGDDAVADAEPLRQEVIAEFSRDWRPGTSSGTGTRLLAPIALDIKEIEILRTMFIDGERLGLREEWVPGSIPVFSVRNPSFTPQFVGRDFEFAIVLDLHDDKKGDVVALDDIVLSDIKRSKKRTLYVRLQVHDRICYQWLNPLPEMISLVSMPMLLGGSRFHITDQRDYVGDALFRKRLSWQGTTRYDYNWSWVGGMTSIDREIALPELNRMRVANGFCTVSKANHIDAAQASVPFDEYLRISRASKVCVSLNGNGPWCLKDGELFSIGAFIMRQWHPVLELNPLTPKAGTHWAVARDGEWEEMVLHYANAEAERERMRRAGFEYFKAMVSTGWCARHYSRSVVDYLDSGFAQGALKGILV